MFKARVSKLWPTNQIQPTVCFSMTYELRMVFTFLKCCLGRKEECAVETIYGLRTKFLLSGTLQKKVC